MRLASTLLGFSLLASAASTADATLSPSLDNLGCCLKESYTGGESECAVVTEEQCTGIAQDIPIVGLRFEPGQTCNAAGDDCVPFNPPDILTSASLAFDPDDCFTRNARPWLVVGPGIDVTVCAVICNDTGIDLTHFTLFIDPFANPEFSNSASFLPNQQCTGVRKTIDYNFLRKFRDPGERLIVTDTWCASNATISMGGCAPPNGHTDSGDESTGDVGGAAGPGAAPVFTDTQRAFIQLGTLHGAPALEQWGLNALTAGLVGFGVWRLTRRAKRRD
jgi:hypothetical protein